MITKSNGGLSVKGVDISRYQKGIDYKSLKNDGVKFVIIRAGCSLDTDSVFEEHVKGCITAGIDYGYYWYSRAADPNSVLSEAAACIKAIEKFPAPKYPVFFDGEKNSIADSVGKKGMTKIALMFVAAIENGGYPAGIYASSDWLQNKYDSSEFIDRVDLWLASWTDDPYRKPTQNFGQVMWQWGVTNYEMDVDADICFVDYPAQTKKWYADHGVQTKTVK